MRASAVGQPAATPADRAASFVTHAPVDSENLLDAAVEYTFPASDPIAIETAFEARRREEVSRAAPDRHQPRSVS
jgi:hypothetical protein